MICWQHYWQQSSTSIMFTDVTNLSFLAVPPRTNLIGTARRTSEAGWALKRRSQAGRACRRQDNSMGTASPTIPQSGRVRLRKRRSQASRSPAQPGIISVEIATWLVNSPSVPSHFSPSRRGICGTKSSMGTAGPTSLRVGRLGRAKPWAQSRDAGADNRVRDSYFARRLAIRPACPSRARVGQGATFFSSL